MPRTTNETKCSGCETASAHANTAATRRDFSSAMPSRNVPTTWPTTNTARPTIIAGCGWSWSAATAPSPSPAAEPDHTVASPATTAPSDRYPGTTRASAHHVSRGAACRVSPPTASTPGTSNSTATYPSHTTALCLPGAAATARATSTPLSDVNDGSRPRSAATHNGPRGMSTASSTAVPRPGRVPVALTGRPPAERGRTAGPARRAGGPLATGRPPAGRPASRAAGSGGPGRRRRMPRSSRT